jgi:hypothetical protein
METTADDFASLSPEEIVAALMASVTPQKQDQATAAWVTVRGTAHDYSPGPNPVLALNHEVEAIK